MMMKIIINRIGFIETDKWKGGRYASLHIFRKLMPQSDLDFKLQDLLAAYFATSYKDQLLYSGFHSLFAKTSLRAFSALLHFDLTLECVLLATTASLPHSQWPAGK